MSLNKNLNFKHKYNRETLGETIKEYRLRKSMSQESLAEKLGVTRQYIIKLEKGKTGCSMDSFLLLMEVLKIPTSILIELSPFL